MPITKPKPPAQVAPSPCPQGASRSPSVTPSYMFPPPLSKDTRLKRPLASRRTGDPRTAEGRSLNAIKHEGYVTASTAAHEFQVIFFELVSRINPVGVVEEAHRTFASTNQQTEGLTQTRPQKSHIPAKRVPTSVNELKSALGLLQQHCKTD